MGRRSLKANLHQQKKQVGFDNLAAPGKTTGTGFSKILVNLIKGAAIHFHSRFGYRVLYVLIFVIGYNKVNA